MSGDWREVSSALANNTIALRGLGSVGVRSMLAASRRFSPLLAFYFSSPGSDGKNHFRCWRRAVRRSRVRAARLSAALLRVGWRPPPARTRPPARARPLAPSANRNVGTAAALKASNVTSPRIASFVS